MPPLCIKNKLPNNQNIPAIVLSVKYSVDKKTEFGGGWVVNVQIMTKVR